MTGNKRFPWLPISLGIILCGPLIWTLWNMWQHINAANLRGEEQATRIISLEDKKRHLESLLQLEPCAARERTIQEKAQETEKPETGGKNQASIPANDMEAIEAACVFLVTPADKMISTGSGFFVAPGVVLTNRHVVEKGDGRVFVTSKYLGKPVVGKIAVISQDKDLDCAIVQLEMPKDTHAAILPFAKSVSKTQKVGAWGYPGLVGQADPAYMKLLAGKDFTATPELSYTEGVISAVLDRNPPLLVHTAPISPGNSGGPLVNEAGEVSGINTQITLDEGSYRQASIAIAAEPLKKFLRQNGIQIKDGSPATK